LRSIYIIIVVLEPDLGKIERRVWADELCAWNAVSVYDCMPIHKYKRQHSSKRREISGICQQEKLLERRLALIVPRTARNKVGTN